MLSDELSIGDLLKLRENIGTKKFDQITTKVAASAQKSDFKREHKRHPRETTSKRKVSVLRKSAICKRTTRDPRFDDLSGEFDESRFQESYSFLGSIRSEEKTQLQTELKKCKDPKRRDQLVRLINKINTSEKSQQLKTERHSLKVDNRKQALEKVKQGKNPYFAKRADLKKTELRNKFDKLKKDGQVDKYLAKRRKKNLQKDKKTL